MDMLNVWLFQSLITEFIWGNLIVQLHIRIVSNALFYLLLRLLGESGIRVDNARLK